MAQSIPRRIMQGGNEVDELPFDCDLDSLIWQASYALDLIGAAYFGIVYRGASVEGMRWYDPRSITPLYDKTGARGLLGFQRQVGNSKIVWQYDEKSKRVIPDRHGGLGWVWALGLNETGSGKPLDEWAGLPDKLLRQADELMESLFDRGAVAQHLITAEHNPGDPEKSRIKSLLQRVFFGGTSTANSVEIFNQGLSVEKVGTDPDDLALETVNEGNMADIGAILDTPSMLLNPDTGANRALLDRVTANWLNYTVMPHAQRIISAINFHVLEPLGYMIELNPSSMTIEQEEERQRAQAWTLYVSNGVNPETAAAMLGLDIPEGMEFMSDEPVVSQDPVTIEVEEDDADDMDDEDESEDRKAVEIAKCRKYYKKGNRGRDFVSDILTVREITDIRAEFEPDDMVAKFEEAQAVFIQAMGEYEI
jgi:hypothetical protein